MTNFGLTNKNGTTATKVWRLGRLETLKSSVLLGLVACVGSVSCTQLTGGASTEGNNSQSGPGSMNPPTRGEQSGCSSPGAQATFEEGDSFAKFGNGRIAEGLVIKVPVRGSSSLTLGTMGRYVQSNEAAPPPSQAFNAMGVYQKEGYWAGYTGGSYTLTSADGSKPAIFDADGRRMPGIDLIRRESGQPESELSYFVTDFYGKSVRVGKGRRFDMQNGKDMFLLYPTDGSCWGVLAKRGKKPGINNETQHSIEGGSFAIWVPRNSSGQVYSGQQQQQQPPQYNQQIYQQNPEEQAYCAQNPSSCQSPSPDQDPYQNQK